MSSCKSTSNVCCGGACMTKNSNNLLLWKDVKKSAIAFSSILSTLLLIKYVNLPSLFFRISTFALLISALAEYAGRSVTGTGFIAKLKPQFKGCAGKFVETYAPHFVTVFKKLELKAYELFTAVNVENSVKAGVASFFLYKLTSCFSLWTLTFVLTILAFSVPKIYILNQKVIDENIVKVVDLSKEQLNNGCKVAHEKFGPQIEKAKKVVDPVWKIVESKLPVRTAGTTVAEPIPSATTSSSKTHETETSKKPVATTTEEAEVDFNKLGEELKREAQNATANVEAFAKEKIDQTSL